MVRWGTPKDHKRYIFLVIPPPPWSTARKGGAPFSPIRGKYMMMSWVCENVACRKRFIADIHIIESLHYVEGRILCRECALRRIPKEVIAKGSSKVSLR